MSLAVHHVTRYLETLAPLTYQADYDNAGLQVGRADAPLQGVLIALDPTEDVLKEAVAQGCNLVITHHPLIFRPVRHVTSAHPITRAILYAAEHHLNLYAMHTNLDHSAQGLNRMLGERLGLQHLRILAPLPDTHHLLTTFVPPNSVAEVRQALFQAGAGHLPPYESCHFISQGVGMFKPTDEAQPHIGAQGVVSQVEEVCLRVVFSAHARTQVMAALSQAHPYETPVSYTTPLAPHDGATLGAGMIGTLPQPLAADDFIRHLKTQLNLAQLRYTEPPQPTVQSVALCTGSGSTLLPHACRAQADAFVTADVKYHQFFDALEQLMLVDIGHYESEIGFNTFLYKLLSEKFDNIALRTCTTYTNPIRYQ